MSDNKLVYLTLIANNEQYQDDENLVNRWDKNTYQFLNYHYLHGKIESIAGYDCVGFVPTLQCPEMPVSGGVFLCEVIIGSLTMQALMIRWWSSDDCFDAYIVSIDDADAIKDALEKFTAATAT